MRVNLGRRAPGELPVGALVMVPLGFVPLAIWLLTTYPQEKGGCLMKMLWGLPCLTCGGTRATTALLQGELLVALRLQPLIVTGYAVLTVWGIISLWAFLTKRSLVLDLSRREDWVVKGIILGAPFVNWLYLYTAGI